MIVLNFGHPLTDAQMAAVAEMTGQPVEAVRDIPAQFDIAQPFAPQARALAEAAGLTTADWQTQPLLVNLPSFNVIAALLLAELHGRCGYFPAVLRLRPVSGSAPPRFEVAEIVNLQAVRDEARTTR